MLRGLPPVFNGLKTAVRAVRTRGTKLSFEEVVTMLNSEDIQLLQDSSSDLEKSTVLISTQSNQVMQPNVHSRSGSQIIGTGPNQGSSVPNVPMNNVSFGPVQPMPAYNNYYPQVQNSGNNRGFSRERGNRGSRYTREPCGICGRTNHVTAYCYYNNNNTNHPQQQQWKGNFSPTWSTGPITIGVPMTQSSPTYFGTYVQQYRGNMYGNPQQVSGGLSFSAGNPYVNSQRQHFSGGQQLVGQPVSQVNLTGQPVSQANTTSVPQAYFTNVHGQGEVIPGSSVCGQQGTRFSTYGQYG